MPEVMHPTEDTPLNRYIEELRDSLRDFTGIVLTPIGRRRLPQLLIDAAKDAERLLQADQPRPQLLDLRLTLGDLNDLSNESIHSVEELIAAATTPEGE